MVSNQHLNRGLFSDHYLETNIKETPEWKSETLFATMKKVHDDIQTIFKDLNPKNLDEAQLEDAWIKPVLALLGHHWQVQIKLRASNSYLKPDYVIVNTADEAAQLTKEIYQANEIRHAIAVIDAKAWGINLDQAKSKNERNPSQQIDDYLRYSELKWGILTDGKYWRLYEGTTSKHNIYYAIDLEHLLEQGSLHDFYYFYLFFRREAFLTDAWLDKVLKGSTDFAEGLSDTLEDEVYDALTLIAHGFLEYGRNWRGQNPPNLAQIYTQSLVLLYRLLFILYAESRDILPMSDNIAYKDGQSLTAINGEAMVMLDNKPTELARRTQNATYYDRLSTLFYNIDLGSEEYNITAYNGRLFSDLEYPFLAEKHIGDAYLAPALNKLTRILPKSKKKKDKPKPVSVDYRDLDVRHLGAIYEKLLEYELAIADTDLSLKSGKYSPAGKNDKVIVEKGKVYLRTGNNERKITGSYYTPDYIVSFIVEQSLQPLLQAITDRYSTMDAELGLQIENPQALRDEILALNILDPATGSGHFMVEVVTQLAQWLTRLNLVPGDIEAHEEELNYWKRQVINACVYGIDVNPLAVELAKLSLWLTTISRGRPLSFLDHHVRLGNTLVGARLNQLGAQLEGENPIADTPQQLDLFASQTFTGNISTAVHTMSIIEHTIASVVSDVKQQEKSYTDMHDKLSDFRQVSDLWTARHFGLKVTQNQWQTIYQGLIDGKAVDDPDIVALLQNASQLAEQHHFFHWELAFPEVFFDEQGKLKLEAGFDAIVGNPPYVRQERIKAYKDFFEANYDIYSGTADLFLYFYERGLKLIKPSQRVAYITSGTYMNSNSAKPFRQYIHEHAAFETLVNFGENQPFKGAEMVYPTMAILKKDKPQKTFKSLFVNDVYRRHDLGKALDLPLEDTLSNITGMSEWRFQSVELTELFNKLRKNKITLEKITKRLYSGIKTGLNEAFIINETSKVN